ncbi:MAG: hypothetical protein DCC75_01710 [Proteobacteria bacterium]|nr:MAG: hypothetical protein DCC75_01710 [Pseudomonadota bacterium]
MDGPGDAVGVNIGGAYLANKITGRGVGLYGSASSQVLIANNIVDTEGAALSILGLDDGVSILNNTFLSGGTNPSQASVIKIGRYDGNDPASYSHNPVIDFRNNLVMDDDPSSNSYCLSFFNVRYFNRSRIDSNNYFGCRGFGSFHQGPPKWPGFFPSSVFSAASLEESLEQWRSFLLSAPDQSNSDHSNEDTSLISPPHETFESYQDGDLRPALGGSALDNGSSANSPSSDYSGGVRPVDIYSQGRDSTGEAHDRGAIERPCL